MKELVSMNLQEVGHHISDEIKKGGHMRLYRYRFVIVLLMLEIAPRAYGFSIDEVEGYYATPSVWCTKFDEGRNSLISCKEEFQDCLLITAVDKKRAKVEIYSTQANLHICAVNGIAEMVDGKLRMQLDGVKGQFLDFSYKDGISIRQHMREGEPAAYCGAYANFDELQFEMVDKNVSKHSCFKD